MPKYLERTLDYTGMEVPSGPLSSFAEGLKQGFLETPVPAYIRAMIRPQFPRRPLKDFNPLDVAPEKYPDLVIKYPWAFAYAHSPEEIDYIAEEIKKKEQDKARLAEAGVFGMVGAFAGGMVDPLVLVPMVGAAAKASRATTAADVMKTAVSPSWQVGLGAMASEGLGSVADPTHTPKDTMMAGLYGAIGGALLGAAGAAHAVRTFEKMTKALDEMQLAEPISTEVVKERLTELVDPGGVARQGLARGPLISINKAISPVIDTLESPLESARKIQAIISDAGVLTQAAAEGKVVAPLGTIENRVHRNYGPLGVALQTLNENYAKYVTGKKPSSFAPEKAGFLNAKVTAGFGGGKMDIHNFEKEVVKALIDGDHPIKEVADTAKVARQAIDTLGKEMEAVGLIPEGTVGKQNTFGEYYITLALDYDKIQARPNEFVQELIPYFAPKIEEEAAKASAKKLRTIERLTKLKEDLADPKTLVEKVRGLQDEIGGLRVQLNEKFPAFKQLTGYDLTPGILKRLSKLEPPPGLEKLVKGEDGILRMEPLDPDEWRKAVRKLADQIKKTPEWQELSDKYLEANTRLKTLRKFAPTPKQAERAGKTLAEAPEKAARTVERAANRMSEFMHVNRVQKVKLSKLKHEFRKLQTSMKKLQDEGLILSDKFNSALKRAAKALDRVTTQDQFLKSEFWQEFEQANRALAKDAADRVLKLGKRAGKAEETLKIDEKAIQKELAKIDEELAKLGETEFDEFLVVKDGKVDAEATARKFLEDIVVKKDKKSTGGINELLRDVLAQERGAELARKAFRHVPQKVMLPWIHNDMTSLMRTYWRTVAPDIELKRTFGTVQIESILKPLEDEFQKKLLKAESLKEREKLRIAYRKAKHNLTAELGRLRGTWGLPRDPDSWFQRFGEGMRHHNVSTKLGMVLFPSATDVGKINLKVGPTTVVKSAIRTLLGDLRKSNFDIHSYALALGVNERLMATRLRQISETTDQLANAGPFLQAERWIAGKALYLTGLPTLNQWMKELAIVSHMTWANNAIKRLADKGAKALTKKERDLLTQAGIDEAMAKRIMKQAREDPFTYWDEAGNWFENTTRWTDHEARLVYESMLIGEANRLVVTPGLEKPKWADASELGRNVYQFRGYLFSSTQKIMLAGMQHPDAAFGVMMATSMVLGAANLWLRAQIIGGEFKAKMENWTMAKWFDEAIDQAGFLGIFTEANRMLQMIGIPVASAQWWIDGTAQYPARYAGQNVAYALGGPSAGALFSEATPLVGEIANAMFDPDEELSARAIRRGRSLMWFNNNLIMRHAFDMLEQTTIDMFGLKERQKK